MTSIQPVNTTYEPFSREPEYIEANRGFVSRQPLGECRRILDLACGTGTVSEILLEAAPKAHLNGIDYDPVQIQLATEHFQKLGYQVKHGFELTQEWHDGKPVLVFGVGSAMDIPFPDESFDCVIIANAIHVMPDKDAFLAAAARVLKRGGIFGFNSVFYAGAYPAGTEAHTFNQLKVASAYIEEKNNRLRAEGKPIIRRKKGTTRAAFQNRWYSPPEWQEMLGRNGLAAHDVHERCILLDERCLAAVGAYGGLAEVVMSGYPVEEASEALQATAGKALELTGLERLPRNWLEIWATKT
jgi:ubiquinone/menaquinone biosynthesis C-methylase UbiE